MRAQRRGSRGSRGGPCVPSSGAASPSPVAGWVEPEWAGSPLCAEVRGLIGLAPGPELAAALAEVPMVQACPAGPGSTRGRRWTPRWCSPIRRGRDSGPGPPATAIPATRRHHLTRPIRRMGPHPLARRIRRGSCAGPGGGVPAAGLVPGFPCCCQLLLAAAWEAQSAWTGVQAGRALLSARARTRWPRRRWASPRRGCSTGHGMSCRGAAHLPALGVPPAARRPRPRAPDHRRRQRRTRRESWRRRRADAVPDGDADSGAESGAVGSGLRVSALGRWWTRGCCSPRGCARSPRRPRSCPPTSASRCMTGWRADPPAAGRGRASWPAWSCAASRPPSRWPHTPPDDAEDADEDGGDARGGLSAGGG